LFFRTPLACEKDFQDLPTKKLSKNLAEQNNYTTFAHAFEKEIYPKKRANGV
jgi:hypothetical protein